MNKIIFLFIIFIFCDKLFSQSLDSLYYLNPDYHIAKELFNKKIVMLGDYNHHQPEPFSHLLNVLNNWLKIAANKSRPKNLTLILETDSSSTNLINDYCINGDIKPLFDKWAPDGFIEQFEYYANLRKFCNCLDSVNRNRKNKIHFTIKGFEEEEFYANEKLLKQTVKENALWFVNVRDSVTASGIINYIDNNPKEQILIFYGSMHLLNGFVNKYPFQKPKELTENETYGYYLVHYLKNRYGNNEVTTFDPPTGTQIDNFKNPEIRKLFNQDFIYKPAELNNSGKTFDSTNVNYCINYRCKFVPLIKIDHIYSKYVLDRTIEKINQVKEYLPSEGTNIATGNYLRFFNDIEFLTRNYFKDTSEINSWLSKNNYDTIQYLSIDNLIDLLKEQIKSKENKNSILRLISDFGLDLNTIRDGNMDDLEQWKENKLPEILAQIKFTNSIGIYWLGYPDEKIKAKEYLIQYSGHDYNEPEKYLQWYRLKYFGYDFN